MWWEFSVSAQVNCQKGGGGEKIEADSERGLEDTHAHALARTHKHTETHFYKNQSQRYTRKVLVVIGWTAEQ